LGRDTIAAWWHVSRKSIHGRTGMKETQSASCLILKPLVFGAKKLFIRRRIQNLNTIFRVKKLFSLQAA